MTDVDYDPAEVRAWAKQAGLDVEPRGRIKADVVAEWRAAHPVDDQDDGDTPVVITLAQPPDPTAPDAKDPTAPSASASPRREEVRPQGRKVSAAERFRQRVSTAPKGKRPKRVSIEEVASGMWGLLGLGLMQLPQTVPVGRVLAMQAPVIGIVAEEQAKDTFVDKVLQPIARAEGKAKTVAAVFGPPALVGIMTQRPDLAPVCMPVLKTLLLTWADIAGPAMEKVEKRAAQFAEQNGGVDIDALIEAIFSTEGLPVQESQDEEDAIRRARGDG